MVKAGVAALGFALIVIFGVISIPAAVDRTDSTEVETQRIEIGETAFYNHQITIGVIDSGNNDATINVIDSETDQNQRVVLPSNETETLQFSGGNLTVTNELSNNQAATITLRYPSNYGFSPAANRVGENLNLVLITAFFIAIMAFVGVRP